MVGWLSGGDDHIIYIYLNIAFDQWAQYFVHEPLISGPNIFQTEGHYLITIIGGLTHECRFVLICWVHRYLV